MLKPPDLERPPRRPSFMSRKETRYVIAMVLVFLFMCFVIATQILKKKPSRTDQLPATVGARVPPLQTGAMPGVPTPLADVPVPDAEAIRPSSPPTSFAPDPKIWDRVDDDALNTIEVEPFYYCLHMINSMNQSEIVARAKADKITIEDLVNNPESCRGKFVSFQGGYINEYYSIAEKDNRAGVKVFWEGVVHNAKINRFFTVYFIEKQRAFDRNPQTGSRDVVSATGVFLKRYRFTSEKKNTIGHNYLLVARMLEPGTEVKFESAWGSPILWIAGAIVIVVLAILFIFMRIESRRSSEAEHAFKVRHRKKIDDEFVRGQVKNPDAARRGKDKPDRPADS